MAKTILLLTKILTKLVQLSTLKKINKKNLKIKYNSVI